MINLLVKNKSLIMIGIIILICYFIWTQMNPPKSEEFSSDTLENPSDENIQVEENSPVTIYNFNTSWCKYSVMFAPEWSKLESIVENDSTIEAIDVKCDDENNNSICQKFDVPGFPSVVIVKDNNKINYEGARNAEAILDFVKSL